MRTTRVKAKTRTDAGSSLYAIMRIAVCLETGRLPLYASKEFTELIAHSMKGSPEAAEVTIASMYEVMRKDLVSDNYKAFKNLQFNSIMLPNPVVPIDTK